MNESLAVQTGAHAWNRSCSVVNRRKTELSFAHARFLLRHYAHARTDRAGIHDRVLVHFTLGQPSSRRCDAITLQMGTLESTKFSEILNLGFSLVVTYNHQN